MFPEALLDGDVIVLFRQSNRNIFPIHFIYRQTFRLLIDKYNKLFKKGLCDSQGN